MPRLLRICAARTANELNVRDVADDLGLPYRTVGSYLTHLQSVFLLQLMTTEARHHLAALLVLDADIHRVAGIVSVEMDARPAEFHMFPFAAVMLGRRGSPRLDVLDGCHRPDPYWNGCQTRRRHRHGGA